MTPEWTVETDASLRGQAVVELMGHVSHAGFVESVRFGQNVLFRVDEPMIPAEQRTMKHRTFLGDEMVEAGSVLEYAEIPARSVWVGAAAVYRITPCTEDQARHHIMERGDSRVRNVVSRAEAVPEVEDDCPF